MADQQLRAVGRQDEVLHAVQRRDLADLAAVAVDGADLVVAGPGAVAGEVEGRAVRRQLRRGDFPLAGGEGARGAVALRQVQVRVPALLRQQPQRAVGRPAEVVEAPVDPGRVGQAVPGLQRGLVDGAGGGGEGGDPAILVVDRAQEHRGGAAVVAPGDRRTGTDRVALHAYRTVAFQRRQLGLLAQVGQRVGADAGKTVQGELRDLAGGGLHQPQLVGQRGVAADAGADFLELLVAGLGDVHRHLAALALVGALGLGHHQQPAGIRGQGAVDDDDVLAQVRRRRRAGRVDGAPGFFLLANGLAAGALGGQGLDQAQLAVAQVVGARFRRGVLGGLHQRRLRKAGARLPLEPVVAGAEHEVPVAAPLRPRLALVGAGHLGQGAAAQVADEHVAIAHERHARALRIEHGPRGVDAGARRAVDDPRLAAVDVLHVQVADAAALALERVVGLATVPRPPDLFHRRPDPVRIGHDPVQRQRLRGLRLCHGGEGGQEQAGQQRSGSWHCVARAAGIATA